MGLVSANHARSDRGPTGAWILRVRVSKVISNGGMLSGDENLTGLESSEPRAKELQGDEESHNPRDRPSRCGGGIVGKIKKALALERGGVLNGGVKGMNCK